MDGIRKRWRPCQILELLADHTENVFVHQKGHDDAVLGTTVDHTENISVYKKGHDEAVQDPHSHDPRHLDNIRVISRLSPKSEAEPTVTEPRKVLDSFLACLHLSFVASFLHNSLCSYSSSSTGYLRPRRCGKDSVKNTATKPLYSYCNQPTASNPSSRIRPYCCLLVYKLHAVLMPLFVSERFNFTQASANKPRYEHTVASRYSLMQQVGSESCSPGDVNRARDGECLESLLSFPHWP